MELALNMGAFEALDQQEMLDVDGGFAISLTVALIALGGACFVGGLTAGVAVALNRKNRMQAQ